MTELPLPIIERTLCTGCGLCISLCPTAALAAQNERAVLAAPERCTYCRACEESCPEGAIALPFLIVFATRGPSPPSPTDRPFQA
jgi:ferredoxin